MKLQVKTEECLLFQVTGPNIFHTEIFLSPDIAYLESGNSFFISFVLILGCPLYFIIVAILI